MQNNILIPLPFSEKKAVADRHTERRTDNKDQSDHINDPVGYEEGDYGCGK